MKLGIAVMTLVFLLPVARGEDPPATDSPSVPVTEEIVGGDSDTPVIETPQKPVVRRKDAGSRAKERFHADTVPKSQYSIDGKPLSVDPD